MNFTKLDRLSDEQIRSLWAGIQEMNSTPAGRALIHKNIEELRAGKLKQPEARPAQVPAGYVAESDPTTFFGDTEQ